MIKSTAFAGLIVLIFTICLSGCNEPQNPLLGQWRQVSPTPVTDRVIIFTPSTMQIDQGRVTVIYQYRDNQVRVSASRKAIIYTFADPDTVTYEDEKHGTVTLARIRP
jgi:hypothetical protein